MDKEQKVKFKKKDNRERFTFRLETEIIKKVDAWRITRPGNVSRNQAMTEILTRGLAD